jgi:hypothetical protein
VDTSHSRIVPSLEPEARRPSGSTHSATTQSQCPSRRAVSPPVDTSHSRIVPRAEPAVRRPSGSTHSALTRPRQRIGIIRFADITDGFQNTLVPGDQLFFAGQVL